jgi:hypothetical protein
MMVKIYCLYSSRPGLWRLAVAAAAPAALPATQHLQEKSAHTDDGEDT